MRTLALVIASSLFLIGCAATSVWAPDEAVAKAAYRHDGPTRLTLFTMVNNRNGSGGHTSLMINGSQRVIFDPAGSFKHETIPERNDVIFGITPQVADVYTRFHARKTWHVRIQQIDVSPEKAERVMRLAQGYGAVPGAFCAHSTSAILAEAFPGQVSQTFYPVKLADQFSKVPGVTEQRLHEYDSDDNSKVLREWNPDAVARAVTLN
ncbi:MAG: hypothetical protein AAFN80_14770 [Pseudomonadota bacterium]